jgi:hypothetical protein
LHLLKISNNNIVAEQSNGSSSYRSKQISITKQIPNPRRDARTKTISGNQEEDLTTNSGNLGGINLHRLGMLYRGGGDNEAMQVGRLDQRTEAAILAESICRGPAPEGKLSSFWTSKDSPTLTKRKQAQVLAAHEDQADLG